MTNFGTSFDVEMGVARKDRTHGQTLTTRRTLATHRTALASTQASSLPVPRCKPLDYRKVLTGIIVVLKTGIPWEELPQEMGCGLA